MIKRLLKNVWSGYFPVFRKKEYYKAASHSSQMFLVSNTERKSNVHKERIQFHDEWSQEVRKF